MQVYKYYFLHFYNDRLTKLNKYKTLKVTNETYNQLSQLGTLQDSFDTVIKKLITRQKEKSDIN